MTRFFSSPWLQVCLLAVTMSLYACGQREMVLPKGTTNLPATQKENIGSSSEAESSENPTSAMRFRGFPERKNNGGGPIIAIEDTHFKSAGAK